MNGFTDKVAGALYGGAIGDGMAASVEGYAREMILEKCGTIESFLPPYDWDWRTQTLTPRPERETGKGNGRITDDTVMTEALIRCYLTHGKHLDAFAYREVFSADMASRPVWIPEWQREAPVLERLARAEQWHIRGLLASDRDPRFWGGNLYHISCGAAMCAWPVGAANPGDPVGAYREATAFFGAQTYSYGLESAAVMAAAVAEAFAPDATARSVIDAALNVAPGATREMIFAAVAALVPGGSRDKDLPAVRAAVSPWHIKSAKTDCPSLPEGDAGAAKSLRNIGIESNLHACEEMPVALAMLLRCDGDPRETICAAGEYGNDCDSIAGMAGSLVGALRGASAIPDDWKTYSDRQNRRDYTAQAGEFAKMIEALALDDERRINRRKQSTGVE